MIRIASAAGLCAILAIGCAETPAIAPKESASAIASPAATTANASPTQVPQADPGAQGMTARTLASRISADPLGGARPYVSAYELPNQGPRGALDHGALPSIAYGVKGTVRWTTASGRVIDLHAGEAVATPTEGFVETNPGTTTSVWYTFLVYTLASRDLLINGMQREIAASPMLPVPQPAGPYTLRLDLVGLEAGGRTAATTYAGATVLVVIDGDVEVRQPGDKHDFLSPGKGFAQLPGGSLQVFNRGSMTAQFLKYFYTPESKPFETLLGSPIQ